MNLREEYTKTTGKGIPTLKKYDNKWVDSDYVKYLEKKAEDAENLKQALEKIMDGDSCWTISLAYNIANKALKEIE